MERARTADPAVDSDPDQQDAAPDAGRHYRGFPPVVLVGADGAPRLAPFLLAEADLIDLFRLAESRTKFPRKTIQRYRKLGLRSVRVGRRVWFRLDDVLRFLDERQERLRWVR